MNTFSQMNITLKDKAYVGKSIEAEELFDKEIIVHHFKIGPSKYPEKGNGKCLTIQIEFEGKKRVLFTGSGVLMEQIVQVEESGFPFKTTIKRVEKSFKFH